MAQGNKFESQRIQKKWKNAKNEHFWHDFHWAEQTHKAKIKEFILDTRRLISTTVEELHLELPDADWEMCTVASDCWICSNCAWTNTESSGDCVSCQTPRRQSQLLCFIPPTTISQRGKKSGDRRRRKRRKRRRKKVGNDEFAAYWKGMKEFQHELDAYTWSKPKKVPKKAPLNLKIVLVNIDELYPEKHVLYRERVTLHNRFCSFSFWLYFVTDPKGYRFNFQRIICPVVNLTGQFPVMFRDQLDRWLTELSKNKLQLIRKWLRDIPEFQYIRFKVFPSLTPQSDQVDIKMSIKLEPFVGGTGFDYVRGSISLGNGFFCDQVPCKLSNFTVLECAMSVTSPCSGWNKTLVLRPDSLEDPVLIPIHVAKLERANQAIARSPELQHCPLMRFARQCANAFTPTLQQPITFQLDQCHSPQCYLLPLTCDLDRVLNDYIPYYGELKELLIAYVGYHSLSYVQLTAKAVPCDPMPPGHDDHLTAFSDLDDSFAISFSNVHRVECNKVVVESLLVPDEQTESSSSSFFNPLAHSLFSDEAILSDNSAL